MSQLDSGHRTTGSAETAGIAALATLTAAGVVGIWLAWAGYLRARVLFGAWIAATACLVFLARPLGWRPQRRHVHVATLCAALGIAAVTALNIDSSAAHIATDRDPGVYVVGARSLARTGEMSVPGVAGTPFAAMPGIRDGSSGFADFAGDGRRVDLIQSPGLPAMLATAQIAAGDRAMFVLMPLMAGVALAFFAALAMRIAGQWFGLVATAGLSASLAEAYIARDAFAEVPTQALVMGGLWMLTVALRDGHRGRAALAGIAIGAAIGIHFPALTAVAGLVLAAALDAWLGATDEAGARRSRCYAAACATALPVAAAGLVGLNRWNGPYAHAHRSFIRDLVALIVVLVLLWAGAVLLRRRRRLPANGGRIRAWAGLLAATGIAIASLYAVVLRPSVERGRMIESSYPAMVNLQRAAGVAIDPSRSYTEQTMRWLGDYMGPVALILGLAGLAYACVRAVRPESVELRAVLPLAVIATTIYGLQPAAFPDQPWVMRRFAPEVIPLLLVFGTWLLAVLWRAPVRARRVLRTAVLAAAALVVVAPLLVLRPVARASAGHQYLDAIHALCDQIGPDAAVLFGEPGAPSGWYPETIEAFCGVPTARADQPDPAALRRLATDWRARGRRLVLVTSSPTALAPWGVAAAAGTTIAVVNPRALELTIDRPPARYRPTLIRLTYAPVAS